MLVELCGVPGGGKSTLARTYVARQGTHARLITIDMYRRFPEAFWATAFAFCHPRSFIWLGLFVLRYHMRGLFLYSCHLALRACAKHQKALRLSGTALIDEGLAHALVTLPAEPVAEERMRRWLGRIVMPAAIALAEEGNFHRFHREGSAPHPRVMRGAAALRAWEVAVRANVRTMGNCLRASGVPVWVIPPQEQGDASESFHRFLATL